MSTDPEDDYMDEKNIAQRLRKIRIEHNLKQEDIAKVLGIDRSAYSGYELGRSRVSVKNLCRLADIYNMTLSQLVGREEASEVVRVKYGTVGNGVDPIAMLERDEQLLLMYFRLADEKKKKEILDSLSLCNDKNSNDE